MKNKKNNLPAGKLELKRETISNLTGKEMSRIKGGEREPCWENLWTIYHCTVVFTGDPE